MYDAIIVVNGEIPKPSLWQNLAYRTLICTDGAANYLKQFTITPDIIIGDMDSIAVGTQLATSKSLQNYFPGSKIHQIDDQYTTDFEKALNFALQNNLHQILCVGAFGKAADHAMYNLNLIARYQTQLNLMLLHEYEQQLQWIFPLQPDTCISTKVGSIISFFPFPQATLKTQGLQWELNTTALTQTGKGAIRNLTISPHIDIKAQGSCLCFITCEDAPKVTFK